MNKKIKLPARELMILANRMGGDKFTWNDLKDQLNKLTPEQLKQSVQVMPPHNTPDPIKLQPGIGFGTVEALESIDGKMLTETRSDDDFKHHPEQLVLVLDYHSFGDEGDTEYTWNDDGTMTGNVSGKTFKFGEMRKKK